MFPLALRSILADTTDPKIVEARAMVGGGENRKLIRVEGLEVKGKKASTRTWTRGRGGRCRIAAPRRCARGGDLGSGSSISCGTRGGSGGSASSFAVQAGGIRPLVVRLAGVVVTNSQVVEVVLPMAK